MCGERGGREEFRRKCFRTRVIIFLQFNFAKNFSAGASKLSQKIEIEEVFLAFLLHCFGRTLHRQLIFQLDNGESMPARSIQTWQKVLPRFLRTPQNFPQKVLEFWLGKDQPPPVIGKSSPCDCATTFKVSHELIKPIKLS